MKSSDETENCYEAVDLFELADSRTQETSQNLISTDSLTFSNPYESMPSQGKVFHVSP